ncbi:MAG: hypothetical protein CO187_09640 [Zetaproteobacteria bacterium CG_4_9_14_3_um_filter_53_7]|nr:MAG: hypothetical protein CO187_09640 [Zetaproteobacteria bacterium CG_4_9_14_3_um_filter_53_7]
MPVLSHVDREKHTILRTASGILQTTDIIETIQQTLSLPSFVTGMHAIWDITNADVSHLERGDMLVVVDYIQSNTDKRGSGYKIAIAADRDISFGIARMFAILCDGLPFSIAVFRSMELARNWISSES